MHRILGVPDPTDFHAGIDTMGSGCRVDPTVSVMRFGERADVICLGPDVSLYAHRIPTIGSATTSLTTKRVWAYLLPLR